MSLSAMDFVAVLMFLVILMMVHVFLIVAINRHKRHLKHEFKATLGHIKLITLLKNQKK